MTSTTPDVSSLTLNRLSIYLRCLRLLETEGISRVSSQQLARRFELSSSQIRKDLAYFGEFGVRGVGYHVPTLSARLHHALGLDRQQRLVVVGMGNLGSALVRYLGFNDGSFCIVAGVDTDARKVGRHVGNIFIESFVDLPKVVSRRGATIGVIAVPPEAAQEAYDALAASGIVSILNFSPVQIRQQSNVRLKNVDFRVQLEELSFFKEHSAALPDKR